MHTTTAAYGTSGRRGERGVSRNSPGRMTAKTPDRVVHEYRDFSHVPSGCSFSDIYESGTAEGESDSSDEENRKKCRGTDTNFPAKLHEILSREDLTNMISWMPHGRSWRVVNPEPFMMHVASRYFTQTKYTSFCRQVTGWGFKRLTREGPDKDSYYHELFLRGLPHLSRMMRRPSLSKKRSKKRLLPNPEDEPDLHAISEKHPLPPNPPYPNTRFLHNSQESISEQGRGVISMPLFLSPAVSAPTQKELQHLAMLMQQKIQQQQQQQPQVLAAGNSNNNNNYLMHQAPGVSSSPFSFLPQLHPPSSSFALFLPAMPLQNYIWQSQAQISSGFLFTTQQQGMALPLSSVSQPDIFDSIPKEKDKKTTVSTELPRTDAKGAKSDDMTSIKLQQIDDAPAISSYEEPTIQRQEGEPALPTPFIDSGFMHFPAQSMTMSQQPEPASQQRLTSPEQLRHNRQSHTFQPHSSALTVTPATHHYLAGSAASSSSGLQASPRPPSLPLSAETVVGSDQGHMKGETSKHPSSQLGVEEESTSLVPLVSIGIMQRQDQGGDACGSFAPHMSRENGVDQRSGAMLHELRESAGQNVQWGRSHHSPPPAPWDGRGSSTLLEKSFAGGIKGNKIAAVPLDCSKSSSLASVNLSDEKSDVNPPLPRQIQSKSRKRKTNELNLSMRHLSETFAAATENAVPSSGPTESSDSVALPSCSSTTSPRKKGNVAAAAPLDYYKNRHPSFGNVCRGKSDINSPLQRMLNDSNWRKADESNCSVRIGHLSETFAAAMQVIAPSSGLSESADSSASIPSCSSTTFPAPFFDINGGNSSNEAAMLASTSLSGAHDDADDNDDCWSKVFDD